jgi:hypothetical protein
VCVQARTQLISQSPILNVVVLCLRHRIGTITPVSALCPSTTDARKTVGAHTDPRRKSVADAIRVTRQLRRYERHGRAALWELGGPPFCNAKCFLSQYRTLEARLLLSFDTSAASLQQPLPTMRCSSPCMTTYQQRPAPETKAKLSRLDVLRSEI